MSTFPDPGDGGSAEGQGNALEGAQAVSFSHDGLPEMQQLLSDVLRGMLRSLPSYERSLIGVGEASRLPAKHRGTNVKTTVDQLASLVYDQGLLPADLNELIDLATVPSFLDQASIAAIVRNLYPATSVSADLVIRVIGCLGHGKLKPSLTIQAALLKWLIMIQHVVENRICFLQAYSVLFNLLDTAALR